MKNRMLFFLLLLSFVLLVSCGKSSRSSGINKKDNEIVQVQKKVSSIKNGESNKDIWKNKIKNLDTVNIQNDSVYYNISTTVDSLAANSQAVIEGEIVNLEEMTGAKNTAVTKVTVDIKNVLRGNEKLTGATVKVIMRGGTVTVKNLYAGMEERAIAGGFPYEQKKNEKVFVKDSQIPLPSIGSNIVTGINLNLSNTVDQAYNIYLEKNGLGGNDSYSISTPEYNIWKQEGKKYVLNNPRLNSTSDKYLDSVLPEDLNNDSGDEVLANKLNLMTDEINHEIHND